MRVHNGRRRPSGYLHLEMYGSDERQIPGKVSQTLQFDADGELLKLILLTFPELRQRIR